MKSINNLFLIGPMGAGKTTIGLQLARSLGKVFYDSDHYVQEKAGVDINWIFDVEGEDGFRKRELRAINELCQYDNIVLATGGGAILRAENREVLSSRGFVVYLNASLTEQFERVKHDQNRPMVRTENRQQRLQELHDIRAPLYQSVADVEVFTDSRQAKMVVREILDYINRI